MQRVGAALLPPTMPKIRPLPSLLIRGAVAALVVWAMLGLAQSASAAVAYRGATCTSGTFFWGSQTHTVAKPAGTATGDVLILTVRGTLTGTLVGLQWPNSHGWTTLHDNGETGKSYYRVVQAGDTGSTYNVMSYSSATFPLGNFAYGVSAYSGASGVTPLASAGAQATGSSNSAGLPNTTSLQAGSMRHSSVTRANNANATYPAGMTENCEDEQTVAVSMGREAMGAGTTTTRNVSYGSSSAWVATTYVINPAGSCESGAFSMTQPSAMSFPSTLLNGLNQTQPGFASFAVTDERASRAGWNISATSTRFMTGGGVYMPLTTVPMVTGGAGTAAAGNCTLPTNSVGYPVVVPSGITAPAATKIFNAAANTGVGPSNVDFATSLMVPSTTRVGNYTSTWTFTLATGP